MRGAKDGRNGRSLSPSGSFLSEEESPVPLKAFTRSLLDLSLFVLEIETPTAGRSWALPLPPARLREVRARRDGLRSIAPAAIVGIPPPAVPASVPTIPRRAEGNTPPDRGQEVRRLGLGGSCGSLPETPLRGKVGSAACPSVDSSGAMCAAQPASLPGACMPSILRPCAKTRTAQMPFVPHLPSAAHEPREAGRLPAARPPHHHHKVTTAGSQPSPAAHRPSVPHPSPHALLSPFAVDAPSGGWRRLRQRRHQHTTSFTQCHRSPLDVIVRRRMLQRSQHPRPRYSSVQR